MQGECPLINDPNYCIKIPINYTHRKNSPAILKSLVSGFSNIGWQSFFLGGGIDGPSIFATTSTCGLLESKPIENPTRARGTVFCMKLCTTFDKCLWKCKYSAVKPDLMFSQPQNYRVSQQVQIIIKSPNVAHFCNYFLKVNKGCVILLRMGCASICLQTKTMR